MKKESRSYMDPDDKARLEINLENWTNGGNQMRGSVSCKADISADIEDWEILSPEGKVKRKQFERKRNACYKEYYTVTMASELMESDECGRFSCCLSDEIDMN